MDLFIRSAHSFLPSNGTDQGPRISPFKIIKNRNNTNTINEIVCDKELSQALANYNFSFYLQCQENLKFQTTDEGFLKKLVPAN